MTSGAVSGVRIANAAGVPGTLGFLATIPHSATTPHGGATVLVSSYHVVFGAGTAEREPVWLTPDGGDAAATVRCLGHSLYGRLGTVAWRGGRYHVDCAVATVDCAVHTVDGAGALPDGWRIERDEVPGVAETLAAGAVVTKTGAATGTTRGVVVDAMYLDTVLVDGRARPAPGQILVRPARDGVAFSADGDSGAVLRDEYGRIVGLLWGVNSRGESIACHIHPVLHVLGVCPIRVVSAFSSRPGA